MSEQHEDLAERFTTDNEVDQSVREAIAEHKRRQNPVAVWQDGKVVIFTPDQIPATEDGKP